MLSKHLLHYQRYIDDTLCIGSKDDIDRAITAANSYHHELSWELQALGASDIPFLDLSISHNGKKIDWDLFIKPLNIFQYVPFSSCHPQTTNRAVAQGEFLRALRRCSSKRSAHSHIQFLKAKLVATGYPGWLLLDAENRAAGSHAAGKRVKVRLPPHILKVRHSSTSSYRCMRKLLTCFGIQGVVAKSSQHHNFRKLDSQNWCT